MIAEPGFLGQELSEPGFFFWLKDSACDFNVSLSACDLP
jgi:hypothetical protein